MSYKSAIGPAVDPQGAREVSEQAGLHVVLGASGGAGRAIVAELVAQGLAARAVSRTGGPSRPGLQVCPADIRRPSSLRAATAGASVVYMAAQPPYHRWPQEFPTMLQAVVAATADVGAKLVMVDNLYAYGPGPQPMREDTPQAAADAKGRTRAQLADLLMQAHREGRLRVVIGRASDYFGPGRPNSGLTALALQPAVSGGSLRWLGSWDAPHSCAFLPDVARAHVILGTSDWADGHVWHLPHEPAVTGRQFLAMVAACLPSPRRTALLRPAMLRAAAPLHRISRETLAIAYQWTSPFVVDDTEFRAKVPGFQGTPLAVAIRRTIDAGTDAGSNAGIDTAGTDAAGTAAA